jgi:hypothetical protein
MIVEAIKRFQYEEGLYQYYLKTNSEIKISIYLNNPTEYNTILKTNKSYKYFSVFCFSINAQEKKLSILNLINIL